MPQRSIWDLFHRLYAVNQPDTLFLGEGTKKASSTLERLLKDLFISIGSCNLSETVEMASMTGLHVFPGGLQGASLSDVDEAMVVDTFGSAHEANTEKGKPSQQVVSSHDLLPLVLAELRGSLESEDGSDWRGSFVALLCISKTFLHAGSNLLWNTMDSLRPAFALLPWFQGSSYKGIGSYDYSGSVDWERFNFYASRIQHFKLVDDSGMNMSTACLMELFTLPERPDPFFPVLRLISLSPDALTGIPSLFILISPSILSLTINSCIPPMNVGTPASTSPPPENVLTVLPTPSFSARRLQEFTYRGPTNSYFLNQLSKMSSITELWITTTSNQELGFLEQTRNIPLLRRLIIDAENLIGCAVLPSAQGRRFPHLRDLAVLTKEAMHYDVARFLAPKALELLTLIFVAPTHATPFYAAFALYLAKNPCAKDVEARFVGHNLPATPFHASPQPGWPSHSEAKDHFASALKVSKNLLCFEVIEMPFDMASSTLPLIQSAIPCWTHLTRLRVQVWLGSPMEAPTHCFPDLSFLATTIRKYCPNLETLEYHFDTTCILEQDPTLPLHVCEVTSPSFSAKDRKEPHPLSYLGIITGSTLAQASKLELPLARKVAIAVFLDHLFPHLKTVKGSAAVVWKEIDTLVKSYQAQRARLSGQY